LAVDVGVGVGSLAVDVGVGVGSSAVDVGVGVGSSAVDVGVGVEPSAVDVGVGVRVDDGVGVGVGVGDGVSVEVGVGVSVEVGDGVGVEVDSDSTVMVFVVLSSSPPASPAIPVTSYVPLSSSSGICSRIAGFLLAPGSMLSQFHDCRALLQSAPSSSLETVSHPSGFSTSR
jgi:hypothetical protein